MLVQWRRRWGGGGEDEAWAEKMRRAGDREGEMDE
jgi:hypothetical protein